MIYIPIVILSILISILIIKTIRFKPKLRESSSAASEAEPSIDIKKAAQHLGQAIQFQTISDPDENKIDWTEFEKFRLWLEKTYPLTHKTLERETVKRASLLYKWKGTGSLLKPFAILAHIDVVPAETATLNDWKHPPFSGAVTENEIWGRGAADMKNQLVAIFEAVETLIAGGFAPQRDIYLCLGHNEEVQVGDNSGARAMARLLKERNVRLEFVLDEGGAVLDDPPFGLGSPLAMIGIAEKGYADFRLTAFDEGGHAAEPPARTALGVLSQAIAALEKTPMKQKLVSPVTLTFDTICRYMKFPMRLVMANLWLFKELALSVMAKDRQTNAMTRTTLAATMAEASPAANVLPQRASAIINVRILPGETSDDVLRHIKRVIKNAKIKNAKIKIEVDILRDSPAIKSSPSLNVYKSILNCLNHIGADIIPSPYLLTGATDSREYESAADEIYRFYPFILNTSELDAMHATNERIRIDSLAGAIKFNYHFIKKAGAKNE